MKTKTKRPSARARAEADTRSVGTVASPARATGLRVIKGGLSRPELSRATRASIQSPAPEWGRLVLANLLALDFEIPGLRGLR